MKTNKQTIFELLCEKFPESSKQSIQKWLKQGRVVVQNRVIKKKDQLIDVSEEIILDKKKNFELPFELRYVDAFIAVIEKPIGMLSVASLDPRERNVHQYLKNYFKPDKILPVHRLDKEVAGPLIYVKNQEAYQPFKDLFAKRQIHREYRAIVRGKMKEKQGIIERNIVDDGKYKVHISHNHRGIKAITHYQVIAETDEFSLLKIVLQTGKRNQIRVHLSEEGHPIVGDVKYGSDQSQFKGIALYAHKLEFVHPMINKKMSFESKTPFLFKKFLDLVGLRS